MVPSLEATPIKGVQVHPSARVHASAVLEGDVSIGAETSIGPGCLLLGGVGPIRVGARCTLIANACLHGPLELGDRNVLYPNACVGFAPQDVGFDAQSPGPGCVIGEGNTFREGATIHRGKTTQPTRIGAGNYWMTGSHLGHDGIVGDRCVIASGAVLGGHCEIADRVIIGGIAAVHQFVRIGRGAMISGVTGLTLDLPPYFMLTGTNLAGSLNLVGLRRSGATEAQIQAVRWVFKTIYRGGGTPQQTLPLLRARADDPFVAEYIAFIETSKRGICHGSGRATRGTGTQSFDSRFAELKSARAE